VGVQAQWDEYGGGGQASGYFDGAYGWIEDYNDGFVSSYYTAGPYDSNGTNIYGVTRTRVQTFGYDSSQYYYYIDNSGNLVGVLSPITITLSYNYSYSGVSSASSSSSYWASYSLTNSIYSTSSSSTSSGSTSISGSGSSSGTTSSIASGVTTTTIPIIIKNFVINNQSSLLGLANFIQDSASDLGDIGLIIAAVSAVSGVGTAFGIGLSTFSGGIELLAVVFEAFVHYIVDDVNNQDLMTYLISAVIDRVVDQLIPGDIPSLTTEINDALNVITEALKSMTN
jgi:hypothetical protein